MKPVPPHIIASGPPGTQWFGGAVDRTTMTLRVMAQVRGESVDKDAIARALGLASDQQQLKHWSLHAPDDMAGDFDAQVNWILSRLTSDLSAWRSITSTYRLDLFCGLYLERANRGISISPRTMAELSARGIELGFDIYAPEPNHHSRES